MDFFNELQGLMIRYRFRPRKKLAQHFVVNEALVKRLVGLAELKQDDTVLEIGAGTGFLTRELLKSCKVVAVEMDEKLCQLLAKELASEGLNLVCADFLKAELPKFNKVVSLPPYSHCGEIVYRLLENDFELGVLVFQREFAEKLVALPGFKEYCALSVVVQYAFEPVLVQSVSPGFFFPRPKGDSCIVLLRANKRFGSVTSMELFPFFVKSIFRFQNKNLKNALEKSRQFLLPRLNVSSETFDKRLHSLPLPGKKVNLLEVAEFVEVFNRIAG